MKITPRALLLSAMLALAPIASSAQELATPAQIESAVRAGDYRQAEGMLAKVIKARPENARAWYWMAQTQEKLGEPAKSRRALDQAQKLQPDLKFASPGAVEAMRARLARAPAPSTQAVAPSTSPGAIPGYDARPPVGQSPAAQSRAPSTSIASAPKESGGMGWLLWPLGLAALGGGGFFLYSRREKTRKADERERERKALLARANSAFERAAALAKTARFESQESSSFGVGSASAASKATSAISRLSSSGAAFSAPAEREQLQELERDVEALENQAARQAWDEKPQAAPVAAHSDSAFGRGPESNPTGSSGFQGSTPAGSSGVGGYASQPPQTVVVERDSGGGLLQSMMIANALSSSSHGHDRSYERDLERENRQLREEGRSGSGRSREPDYGFAPAPAPAPSAFDLGSDSAASWDASPAPAPVFDSGSSSSSSWDSGSSESSSPSSSSGGFDSGSSSTDSGSSWDSGSSSSTDNS